MFQLTLDQIMGALRRDSLFSLTIPTSEVQNFRRNLSQRKIRLGIPGRLHFTVTTFNNEYSKVDIALLPASTPQKEKAKRVKSVQIKNLNMDGLL